jgi:Fe-S-cluster containining protein
MQTMRVTDPDRAMRIEVRAGRYIEEFGAEFPGDAGTGVLGKSEEEEAAFEDFANDAACPALDPETGLCEVYAARPMTCRVFGPPVLVESDEAEPAYSVCELCFTEASEEEIAACAMDVPQAEEESLLERMIEALPVEDSLLRGETIVAYCLTRL